MLPNSLSAGKDKESQLGLESFILTYVRPTSIVVVSSLTFRNLKYGSLLPKNVESMFASFSPLHFIFRVNVLS